VVDGSVSIESGLWERVVGRHKIIGPFSGVGSAEGSR
jgi:hypothetical protein